MKDNPKMKKNLIKNLKGELLGLKIKIPKKYQDIGIKKEMYLYSYWNKGVWLKTDMKNDRIYPLTFETDCKELLEFEIV